jgi:histidinol-phosphate phosphatase family protein
MRRPAVFLDRDDTLIACTGLVPPPPPARAGDLIDPTLVVLLPGVGEGLARLAACGYALVVVSNQGVVARGGGTLAHVDSVNARVAALLAAFGVRIERFYYCPFHPQGAVPHLSREHPWRKPAPGMITAAAEELGLDLGESWLIGDATRDIEAGTAAGLRADRCLRVGSAGLEDFARCVRKIELDVPRSSSALGR